MVMYGWYTMGMNGRGVSAQVTMTDPSVSLTLAVCCTASGNLLRKLSNDHDDAVEEKRQR